MEKKISVTEKFCTKCGKKFHAVGREVICPECKEKAMEEAKKNAVLMAKRKSWTGEAVPVRISGRASTIIREYSKAYNVPFVDALDSLLKSTYFFEGMSKPWEEVQPYKSTRRKKEVEEVKEEKPSTPSENAPEKPVVVPMVVPMEEKKKAARSASKKATK